MKATGAGRYGWAPMNSANLYGGAFGGMCVCVCVFVCVCVRVLAHACARVRALACVRDVFAIYDNNI